jgi:hypothetical protein
VFPARYELNSYIVCRKRLVSKRLIQCEAASASGRLSISSCHPVVVNLLVAELVPAIVDA